MILEVAILNIRPGDSAGFERAFVEAQAFIRCISVWGQMIDLLPQFIETMAHDRSANGQQAFQTNA